MNQILKDYVYGKGTLKQVYFMASVGGMTEEETQIFVMLHNHKTDQYIQDEMRMSRKSYDRMVESVRSKLIIAIFECINAHMKDLGVV